MDIHEAFRGAGDGGVGMKPDLKPDINIKPDINLKPDLRPIRPNPPGPVPGRPHWRWPPYGPPAYIGYEYINPWRYDGNTIIQPATAVANVQTQSAGPNYNMFLFITIIALLLIIGFLLLRKK